MPGGANPGACRNSIQPKLRSGCQFERFLSRTTTRSVLEKHILIVGTGSVGKRHARNLSKLGCNISCVDPRADRCEELAGELDVAGVYPNMNEAFSADKSYDGVVIGSPPAFHVDQSISALEANIPLLLEKPVSPDLKSARRLLDVVGDTETPLVLGYTWRWWPPLKRVHELLAEEAIGKIRHVKFSLSAHLADWHPWERYQDFFMANRALGGGALLDESHWIDLMIWFFGMPQKLFAMIEHISDLDIDSDDNVDILLSYEDGLRVSVHLDLYGRPHEKNIRFTGESGTILWSESPNQISLSDTPGQEWETEIFNCERNDMFVGVAQEFLSVVGGARPKTCLLNDGVRVLEVLEAARISHAEERVVQLSEMVA